MKTQAEEETFQAGFELGAKLNSGDIVLLIGELGAGKTVFTKGIAKGIGIQNYDKVNSPTYTIVHKVDGKKPLLHFDLYRLENPEELFEIGFDEYLEEESVIVIEWGNKFQELIPRDYYEVQIEHCGVNEREITITSQKVAESKSS